jgi:hypothetical protein
VRETYPVELAKQEFTLLEVNNLKNILKSGKDGDPLRKLLLPHFEYGPNLLEHLCLERGIALSTKLKAGWRTSGSGIFQPNVHFFFKQNIFQNFNASVLNFYAGIFKFGNEYLPFNRRWKN